MPRLYSASVVALIVLSVLLKLWAMRQWSWFQDDWSYIERTVDLDFWPYITQEYNGHFMPLQFLIVWLLTVLSPLNYGWAIVVLALIIVGSTCTWWALLHAVFGRRPQVLVGLAIVAFCPLFLQPTLWWASGLQTYGLAWGLAAVLLCAYRFVQRGGATWFAATLVAFVLSLAAWEKALLILIPAGFLIAVLPGVDRGTLDFRRRAGALAFGLVVVAIAYAAVFLYATAAPVAGDANLGAPSVEGLLGFALTAGLGILAPSIIGGTWQSVGGLQGAFPMAPTWLQWALAVGGLALAVVAVAVRRRAMWILSLPLAYGIAAWGLVVASSRFDSLGQFASLDSRYSADIVPVIALSLVYLTTSTRAERHDGGAWLLSIPAQAAWRFHAACAAASIIVVMSSLGTWSTQMDGLGPNSPRSWTDRLIGSAKNVGAITAFDSNAPDNVVFPAFLPSDARISRMIAPLGVPISFDAPTDQIYVVSPAGEFVPGTVTAQSRSLPGPQAGCGYYVEPGRPAVVVPMSRAMYHWNWGLELGYLAEGLTALRIDADLASQEVPLEGGLGVKQSVMVTSVSAIEMSVPADGAAVCVDYVAFGPVDPLGSS